jgi:hypothetical protein
VNPLPVVTIPSFGTVCVNWTTYTLTGEFPSGGTYSGTAVSGNNFDATQAGVGTFPIYYVYTDANGCTNSDTSSIIVDACTGISGNAGEFGVSVQPNPVKDIVKIASGTLTGNAEILVSNALGQVVYRGKAVKEISEVDLSGYENGTYFITVKNEKVLLNFKVMKVK